MDTNLNVSKSASASPSGLLLAGFDTETTGVNPGRDRIATACVVLRENGQDQVREWVINPGVPMPPGASAVNGLTDEYLQTHGADPHLALEQIASVLADALGRGGAIVAFNAGFDLAILEADLVRHGLPTLGQRLGGDIRPVIDPLVIDRAVDQWRRGKRKLINLIEAYGLGLDRDFHNAQADVVATLDLYLAMLDKYPQLGQLTLGQLHDFQKEKHHDWAVSFNQWLAAKRPGSHPTSTRWPY